MQDDISSATADTAATQRKPSGPVRIFRAADAPDLLSANIMHAEAPPPERAPLAAVFGQAVGLATTGRVLFRDPRPNGFSLIYAWFKSNYPLPVHTHDSDCLYYVISGELAFGNQVLKAGDGFLVPAHAPYAYTAGPEGVEILEFRNATDFAFVMRPSALPRWERAAAICQENFERWKAEVPPARQSTGLG